MPKTAKKKEEWIYSLKKKILTNLLAIMTLSIMTVMVFIVLMVKSCLNDYSRVSTQEMSSVIKSSLKNLMLMRNADMIQKTLEN
ncbi:MAG: hypothetical protein NT096_10450 [Proteobacteria bacterium]|nr:hypothetical protein [Pseudomonadota bacterium]